ncbi:MAG: alanine--tRNA ligase [Verrucomicrobiales bacterium]|nr:alanine--tRNA ligase [Verrucomicrobiales bacterium]
MTSREIRQSFLDFFEEKEHTIVPSASLMPTSPNLKFTNAGMNQFVPYFLGAEAAPYDPPRAADTQKCIRAGGKHNDLDDVGYDTYHHTFFEMLGNWSFGNYFKKEAIEWSWELVVGRWGIPANRVYATVYSPAEGDPAEFDQEAYDIWAKIFEEARLDPKVHIVNGNKKDNFWMMGETGPCGPCSELHIDLTEKGDTKGSLVNMDDARCIEVWNLVFIQFNANEDGTFRELPARHVDTGMGFERICSIIQGTDSMTDFSKLVSNYDTDVFSPIFKALSKMSGKKYTGTVPKDGNRHGLSEQEMIDVAFRVIGDHIRTTCFSIADGIEPGNNDRNYVIRNILRRAVRFGRILGFEADKPFLHELAPVVFKEFGGVFPELKDRKERITKLLLAEETQFNKTLDRGLRLFNQAADDVSKGEAFPPGTVVKLWETYGFPTDLTKLLLDEREIKVDETEVERLVEEHKATGSKGGGGTVVSAVKIETSAKTEFVGYDVDETTATVLEWVENEDGVFAIVDKNPFYIEKGGQQGDTGELIAGDETVGVLGAYGIGEAAALHLDIKPDTDTSEVTLKVDVDRRRGIENHHTATHLFHWALHETVSPDATQQGSLVAPDRLRFDFNSDALNAEQISDIEAMVNRCIGSNDPVSISEVPHGEIKDNEDIMQFFGDKYGDLVRVVQIGGKAGEFDGYSMELCGGTHRKATGDLGFFRVKSEGAIAAGIRRVEAVCGDAAIELMREIKADTVQAVSDAKTKLKNANTKLAALGKPAVEIEIDETLSEKIDAHLDADEATEANDLLNDLVKTSDELKAAAINAEKALKKASAGAAASIASAWYEEKAAPLAEKGADAVFVDVIEDGSPALLQEVLNTVKARQFPGAVAIAVVEDDTIHFGSVVHKDLTGQFKAGDIVRESLAEADGKGGGKPEMARGAAKNVAKLDAVVAKAKSMLGS